MCASDDVLNRQADLIMFTEYRDLDLNETPCIFPHCGHFYTVDTLDGQMSMGDYFDINMLGKVMGFKADAARPFAIDEIKKCADCRGSLRSINRYGRLVRRAMIDESTKRFIVWSNAEYAPLALDLEDIKNILSKLTPNATVKIAARTVKLKGSSDQVFQTVKKAFGQYYSAITMLRHRIMRYYGRVRIQEQPFQTIVDLVENARRRQGIESNLNTEDSLVQTRACLLAKSLLIRCDLLVLTDIMRIRSEATSHGQEAQVDFSKARDACLLLMEEATASKNVLQIAEGNMFFAQYAALERQGGCNATKAAEMLESATRAVDAVKDLVAKHPNQTRPVAVEIDGVERMLNGGVFYEPIANEEMRSVVQAMASEFSGTGHWVCSREWMLTSILLTYNAVLLPEWSSLHYWRMWHAYGRDTMPSV